MHHIHISLCAIKIQMQTKNCLGGWSAFRNGLNKFEDKKREKILVTNRCRSLTGEDRSMYIWICFQKRDKKRKKTQKRKKWCPEMLCELLLKKLFQFIFGYSFVHRTLILSCYQINLFSFENLNNSCPGVS